MGYLHFQPQNAHRVRVEERDMLFHVPTTSLFELDALDGEVLGFLAEKGQVAEADVRDRFAGRDPADVAEKLRGLLDLEIVTDGGPPKAERPAIRIENFPLSTIVLNVNTGCNLACSYCYKEDLDTPSKGRKMAFDTAVKSIDLLLKESPDRDSYNIVFFGGEPLSNLPLIKDVVAHAEPRFAALGKEVSFTLTTNATLLNEGLVDWLDAHRFGLTVSMDGPKALHDLNRKTVGGKGSYDAVAAKARMLLARYRSRPVGARVTLTAGVTAVEEIWDHLKNDIGFAEVGFSPVTSGDMTAFNLDGTELLEVFEGMKSLGRRYHREALEGRNIGFSNMHQLMQDLWEGRSKALPCGAGVGMLAVDHEGTLNLCHRFTGSEMETYGTVDSGVKRKELSSFLESRLDRTDKGCATCRIRNLCAGGCYHESYAHFSDPLMPAYHYCDLMRDWVDFGIGVYGDLIATNPSYFHDHIAPRRANNK
ncbi:quinohemoprotein amine dehydrogenase maturation protein [Sulfitobacter sp. D35]|uniref:quinohemoprotein amine dehydrogenase maturation protein n=1 Tax=Sulfitobacter sp. D35 TaxID=3083252 RepID=UPI00296E5C34|nr:quinohemoprotein amine dehydrogenase maturation protein [Sulfitobacter sp. D35]MDW4497371.1 quinohemoprotein amine dehydrogenase maturation protein [Sulfitobacter sp. D35]